jgi:hypothetical protein
VTQSRLTVILMHAYEVRPRKDHRGVNLISDALPFGRLWYGEPNAISNAKFRSRSHDAVIRILRCSGQRDRNAQARRRFQRAVSVTCVKQSATTQ